MVGRPTQRQGQTKRGEFRKENIELRGVFAGEITCKPGCRSVRAQFRLHTGEVVACSLKCLQCAAKLVCLWPVLGVVNHRKDAFGKWERDSKCLRLREWLSRSNRNHRDGNTMFASAD